MPAAYDSDEEFINHRQSVKQPLIIRQPPATGVPVASALDQRPPSRNDAWSARMREKVQLMHIFSTLRNDFHDNPESDFELISVRLKWISKRIVVSKKHSKGIITLRSQSITFLFERHCEQPQSVSCCHRSKLTCYGTLVLVLPKFYPMFFFCLRQWILHSCSEVAPQLHFVSSGTCNMRFLTLVLNSLFLFFLVFCFVSVIKSSMGLILQSSHTTPTTQAGTNSQLHSQRRKGVAAPSCKSST